MTRNLAQRFLRSAAYCVGLQLVRTDMRTPVFLALRQAKTGAVAYICDPGFVTCNALCPPYRLLDDALAQIDIAIVKETGALCRQQLYTTDEQRLEQMRRMVQRK